MTQSPCARFVAESFVRTYVVHFVEKITVSKAPMGTVIRNYHLESGLGNVWFSC